MLLALLTGCAKDLRPKYVVPTLAPEQLVTIHGTTGFMSGIRAMLEEIDGAKVENGLMLIGSPAVKLTPGTHDCVIYFIQSSRYSSHSWKIKFKHSFVVGHEYEVGVKQWPTDCRARIIDLTTKQELIVQE